MEEEKSRSAIDAIEVLNHPADETQLRSMAISIPERKSCFTVACSKWNENFKWYMTTSDFWKWISKPSNDYGRLHISNKWRPRHTFIRDEFKSLTASQQLDEAENERILLTTRIDELNLARYLEEDLIVFDTDEEVNKEYIHTSEDYKLFKEIQSLSIWKRKRGRRYTKFQVLQLEGLLVRYPTKHQIIRKLLHIPFSSFHSLKTEIAWGDSIQRTPKCRQPQTAQLHDSEKKYIERLIKPPTYPTTILEI